MAFDIIYLIYNFVTSLAVVFEICFNKKEDFVNENMKRNIVIDLNERGEGGDIYNEGNINKNGEVNNNNEENKDNKENNEENKNNEENNEDNINNEPNNEEQNNVDESEVDFAQTDI